MFSLNFCNFCNICVVNDEYQNAKDASDANVSCSPTTSMCLNKSPSVCQVIGVYTMCKSRGLHCNKNDEAKGRRCPHHVAHFYNLI